MSNTERVYGISSEPDGTTTIEFTDGSKITIDPASATQLCDHLIGALDVTIKLSRFGYTCSVVARDVQKKGRA